MHIRKLVVALIIGLVSIPCVAQKTAIQEQVKKTYTYHDDAIEEIDLAILELVKCEDSRSASVIKDYTQNARADLIRAKRLIVSAKQMMRETKEDASTVDCPTLEDNLESARRAYYDAENHISDAIGELRSASYMKELIPLNFQISQVTNYITQTKKKLNAAFIILAISESTIVNCK